MSERAPNVCYDLLVKRQMDALEAMAEAWAVEANLATMIKHATSPMDLNRNAPDAVRKDFRERMEKQIDAIAQQCFIEGAHRAVCMVQDAYRPELSSLRSLLKEAMEALEGCEQYARMVVFSEANQAIADADDDNPDPCGRAMHNHASTMVKLVADDISRRARSLLERSKTNG
jgi:hypothetical protein